MFKTKAGVYHIGVFNGRLLALNQPCTNILAYSASAPRHSA